MRVLRPLAALVILISTTAQAGAASSPEICQRMALTLLEKFNVHQAESKEQVIQFADKCMPESAMSNRSQSYNRYQVSEDISDRTRSQMRI